ncbi:hypothetical protein TraAM80_04374 [Trypanosoma rangeli]|uniref:Uncharacterized protein n=1 Tax=Trypanosoma rangeli TaxID=5698 RepID=A0A3R7MNK3_TRYRA|nr:uncharacterized protein TraAM80_04374 [Trypanosoma rangeli]RNF05750.1 hypothetical protein TraAM80_04374 [Trypanosoma rangeli]|eukprot:RNF05750.1 hypothetical protein TraAM80_04374 [Trypanosoma rangeli]
MVASVQGDDRPSVYSPLTSNISHASDAAPPAAPNEMGRNSDSRLGVFVVSDSSSKLYSDGVSVPYAESKVVNKTSENDDADADLDPTTISGLWCWSRCAALLKCRSARYCCWCGVATGGCISVN